MNKKHTYSINPRPKYRPIALAIVLAASSSVSAQKLFFEDFESRPLGPNREEALVGAQVWTRETPAGWSLDNSLMTGFGNPALDGVTEWSGWSFANRDWWATTAGDQRRRDFTFGTGTVMIADPDEWDDASHAKEFFNSYITTSEVDLTGVAANSLILAFDSSWRPEAKDDAGANWPTAEDGTAINNQTGLVSSVFDGKTNSIVRWESTSLSEDGSENPFFKSDKTKTDASDPDEISNTNEPYVIALNNPAGAKKLKLTFGMINAANDWWWAVDNVAIGVPPLVTGVSGNGVSFRARVVEALGKAVDETKPITVKVDGTAVTPVTVSRNESLVFLSYSQAPDVYPPRSKHNVEVSFTTLDGRQVTDSGSFVAPSYTTVATTPAVITATVTAPSYFGVDAAKGAKLSLNGTAVTATSVTPFTTDSTSGLTLRYALPSALPPGSSNTLTVTFTTDGNRQVVDAIPFTAAEYKTLPAVLATDLGTGAEPGMRWRTHQLDAGRGNSIAEVEQQLAGQLGADVHDTTGQGADGFFKITTVNFEQSSGSAGLFRAEGENELAVPEEAIPGIPGTTSSTDNIGAEALTYVEIPAPGIYTMVVSSDDGFQVSAGNTTNPYFITLGAFDGGRGDSATEFYFQATKAGVYLFRLLWFEGGGGASVEWFTVNPNGTRALVGGSQAGALKAYRKRTVAEPVLTSVPAKITLGPKSAEVNEGDSAKLAATAIGDSPIRYQWYRVNGTDSVAIPNANTAELILSKASAATVGQYFVTAANASGTNSSTPVAVSVLLRNRSKILLTEDFESLALGANVEEGVITGSGGALPAVWTKTPPTDWTLDDSGVPGLGNSATDGVVEWAGWSFAKREWWASTAGDQTRTQFLKGVGTVAIADGDEWDDQPRAAGAMTTLLNTKEIDVAGLTENSVVLRFDSSWRPEAPQKAVVKVSFDGGAPIEVLRWIGSAGANFHPDSQNETVTLKLNNPASARKMKVTFGYLDAGNNWWWALDNIVVSGDAAGHDSLGDGLAVYLPFDGNYQDVSGHGINGTAKGTPTFVPGRVGQAVNVRTTQGGDFSYVSLGRQLLFGTNQNFTVSFWAKLNANTGDPSFIGNKNWNSGGNTGFVIATAGDNRVQWNLNTVGGARKDYDSAGGHFANQTWRNVVVSFDRNGTADTWVDGVRLNGTSISANLGQSLDTADLSLNIGQDGTGSYTDNGGVFHDADLDEVAIWNRILSDEEIARAFQHGTAGTALVTPDTTPTAVVASVSRTGGNLILNWTGGNGPFRVQTAAALGGAWVDAATVNERTATLPINGSAAFVRVLAKP